jgi:hypothetical protein
VKDPGFPIVWLTFWNHVRIWSTFHVMLRKGLFAFA